MFSNTVLKAWPDSTCDPSTRKAETRASLGVADQPAQVTEPMAKVSCKVAGEMAQWLRVHVALAEFWSPFLHWQLTTAVTPAPGIQFVVSSGTCTHMQKPHKTHTDAHN